MTGVRGLPISNFNLHCYLFILGGPPPQASNCATGWTKINQQESGVEWRAKGDAYGIWSVTSEICGRRLMLVAISGGVKCKHSTPYINFGCHSSYGEKISVYVTEGKGYDHAIVPQNMTGSYYLPGKDTNSTFLEYELPTTGGHSDYCFNNGREYNLWYSSDMEDHSEHDNNGTAYTDIYICPSSILTTATTPTTTATTTTATSSASINGT